MAPTPAQPASARFGVRVSPGSRQDDVRLDDDGALRVRVVARAVDGKANTAVIELLASRLGVSRQAVTIVRGAASRSKLIEVVGLSELEMRTRLGIGENAQR